jgi:hypothetical protein
MRGPSPAEGIAGESTSQRLRPAGGVEAAHDEVKEGTKR